MSECVDKIEDSDRERTTFGIMEPYVCTNSAFGRKNDEEARARNKKLLQDLEHAKARLRTIASFTPTDRELHERVIVYRKSLGPEDLR